MDALAAVIDWTLLSLICVGLTWPFWSALVRTLRSRWEERVPSLPLGDMTLDLDRFEHGMLVQIEGQTSISILQY